jgi:hypothetical protein
MQHALKNLETSHIKLTTTQQHIGIESPSSATQTRRDAGLDSSARHTEMNWLARNKDLSDRFGGQWIVLEKDDLIASDADYQKARQTAVHKGIKRPFIIFVPLKENGGFMGI